MTIWSVIPLRFFIGKQSHHVVSLHLSYRALPRMCSVTLSLPSHCQSAAVSCSTLQVQTAFEGPADVSHGLKGLLCLGRSVVVSPSSYWHSRDMWHGGSLQRSHVPMVRQQLKAGSEHVQA